MWRNFDESQSKVKSAWLLRWWQIYANEGKFLWEWFAASVKRSMLRRCLQCNKDVNIGIATMSDVKLRFRSNLVGRVLSDCQDTEHICRRNVNDSFWWFVVVLLDGFSAADWNVVDEEDRFHGQTLIDGNWDISCFGDWWIGIHSDDECHRFYWYRLRVQFIIQSAIPHVSSLVHNLTLWDLSHYSVCSICSVYLLSLGLLSVTFSPNRSNQTPCLFIFLLVQRLLSPEFRPCASLFVYQMHLLYPSRLSSFRDDRKKNNKFWGSARLLPTAYLRSGNKTNLYLDNWIILGSRP